MDIEFSLKLAPFDAEFVDALTQLSRSAFGQTEREYVEWRLTHMPVVTAFVALSGDRIVAFKVGYATSRTKYYSWLGGVHPDFRDKGLASELMRRQHAWLTERGFSSIETAANQENHAMARLNLAHGFSVSGVRSTPGKTQVLFSKQLDS
jgi:predicted GNAT superfamily acetyltransferase